MENREQGTGNGKPGNGQQRSRTVICRFRIPRSLFPVLHFFPVRLVSVCSTQEHSRSGCRWAHFVLTTHSFWGQNTCAVSHIKCGLRKRGQGETEWRFKKVRS